MNYSKKLSAYTIYGMIIQPECVMLKYRSERLPFMRLKVCSLLPSNTNNGLFQEKQTNRGGWACVCVWEGGGGLRTYLFEKTPEKTF